MTRTGLPHSDILGSTLIRQLPEASRSRITSFIGYKRLGIHHAPFLPHSLVGFPLRQGNRTKNLALANS
jgi:hypothetical protein